MNQQDSTSFKIHFTGKQLENHSMSAKEFAVSVLGLNSALDKLTKAALGSNQMSSLQINANLEPGSITASLAFALTAATGILFPDRVPTPKEIVDIFRLLIEAKKVFGSKPINENQAREFVANSGVQITGGNFNNCNFFLEVHNEGLVDDSLKDFASPLSGHVEKMEFLDNSGQPLGTSLLASDYKQLSAPMTEPDPERKSFAKNILVKVLGVRFDDKKWTLQTSDGSTLSAVVEDKEFLQKVHNQEVVFHSDLLMLVDIDYIQKDKNGRHSVSYAVTHVISIEHKPNEIF